MKDEKHFLVNGYLTEALKKGSLKICEEHLADLCPEVPSEVCEVFEDDDYEFLQEAEDYENEQFNYEEEEKS
ncbi:2867_t:CDS:2 [Funneliformis caledonium]|uniref:2867_t:CDS:1 n=1 Tax=Funneliformis caledonium TaxID=1117310 RepID=A0A9N9DSF7_9GLOM|nr:2867_t:CDS:2 [Funneliformis caledonium]